MRLLLLAFVPLTSLADPHAQEIQRALMQLDQRTAEFARGIAPQPLTPDAGKPLHPDPVIAREWRPYERMKAAEGHVLRLPPPVMREKKPLPLPSSDPRGPGDRVEPIPATGVGS